MPQSDRKVAVLPGFYYDEEKNRYFPIKGRFPGCNLASSSSSSSSSSKPPKKSTEQPKPAINISRRSSTRTAMLLKDRELCGNVIYSNREKWNFQEEYCKRQASHPLVWKYTEGNKRGDSALENIRINKQTPDGLIQTSALLTGCTDTTLSLLEVGNAGQPYEYSRECIPDAAWPLNIETPKESSRTPESIWTSLGTAVHMPSRVSSMNLTMKHSSNTADDVSVFGKTMITTMGSETSRGAVYILNLTEPLDLRSNNIDMYSNMNTVASFSCTIWTGDCHSNGRRAVIGTNLGASLVDLETGATSGVFSSKSDVFSQQFDQTGNLVLCGLRNGAIMTIDVRQRQGGSARLTRHRVPYPSKICEPSSISNHNFTKRWFEFKGEVDNSSSFFMPSSVSCLVYLQYSDHHFLASSMDGSIKLYDQRMMHRGAVQSYEGHVNSHSHIQLGVDPSERFVMSGGEDCKMRIWSIKSGELLFEDKFSNSVLSTVCFPRNGEKSYNNGCEAWLGSYEGLFRMHWP